MDALDSIAPGTPGAALILLAIVVASVAGLGMAPRLIEKSLFRPYWVARNNEWWTLITNAFVHADFAHLLFNGFTFWAFAFPLEREIGTEKFLALYAFGLLVSDAGTWLRHRMQPDYRTLGASGAILAVLFASIVYFPSRSIYLMFIPVPIPAPLFAVAYLGYTWWASKQQRGRINHEAHLSGALAGLAFVALADPDAFSRAIHRLTG